MSHEIAKLLLEHANTVRKRREAVAAAISMGMPIHEIEAYLDWLDTIVRLRPEDDSDELPPAPEPPGPTHE